MKFILSAKNLTKIYTQTRGFFSREITTIKALDDVSIDIEFGKTIAVVGESGMEIYFGKSFNKINLN